VVGCAIAFFQITFFFPSFVCVAFRHGTYRCFGGAGCVIRARRVARRALSSLACSEWLVSRVCRGKHGRSGALRGSGRQKNLLVVTVRRSISRRRTSRHDACRSAISAGCALIAASACGCASITVFAFACVPTTITWALLMVDQLVAGGMVRGGSNGGRRHS
jgi:ribosomal protein S12 methylthiotransferase accessory factor YcaO